MTTRYPHRQGWRTQAHARVAATLMLVSVVATSGLAQQRWERAYGGSGTEYGRSVQQTTNNGYIVAGFTKSFGAGNRDGYVVRTDSAGETLWTRTFGGALDDEFHSVCRARDDGYVVVGSTRSFGAGLGNTYLVRLDDHGDTLWSRTYGDSGWHSGHAVQPATDGGYIIAGQRGALGGAADVLLLKTDSLGELLWSRTYGGNNDDVGRAVEPTADGGYILSGYTWSFGAGYFDFYVIKTNAVGDTIWTRTWGGSGEDDAWSVRQTSDSGYIVAGQSDSAGTKATLIKIDATGQLSWTRRYDLGYSEAASVLQTMDAGYMVAGSSWPTGSDNYAAFLIRTDASGETLWTRILGGSGDDEAYSVTQTLDGGYVVAGATTTLGSGEEDIYLVKTDALGRLGVEEKHVTTHDAPSTSNATIVRGVLMMGRQLTAHGSPQDLLDAAGRKVAELRAGPNDISRLAPGVYFMREEPQASSHGPQPVEKVVIAR